MPPPVPGPKPAKPRPGKLFRRFRRTVRAVFIVLLLLPVVLVILTQGPVPKWLVARSVRKATGAEFDASWVSLKLDGRFVATDATLSVPASSGLVGDAARLAEAKRIDVVLDWSAWAAGVVVPTSVKVSDPVVRISLDRATNELNISRLAPAASGVSSISSVPRIDVVRGALVIAEHDSESAGGGGKGAGAGYSELVRLDTDGWVSPVFGTKRYLVRLHAKNPTDEQMAFDLTGEVDLAALRGEIKSTAIELSRWTPERVPSATRSIWEQLRLRGRIAGTTWRYAPETGLDTTLNLDDVSLNAPIASGRAEITGSRNPRMENVTGTLRVVSGGPAIGLHADLRGLFEDLPARVRLDSRALSLDAGYSAVILAERFQLEKDPRILWFAPEVVQRNFEKFSGPTAVIDARIEVTRKPPEAPGVPGETSIAGTLVFENGTAAYEMFPYPMVGMAGSVRFDEEKVHIVGIHGRGPTGARLFAEGTIDPPTADSRYDIRVTATDVPMDSTLRDALLASKGAALVDSIFSQKRYEELLAKGLIRPRAQGGAPAPDAVPPFEVFAGTIDSIQVHVTSGFGREQPVHQDIAVRFKDVHALPDLFPYPLSGSDVSVRIGDDYVAVRGEGLTGLYGGNATVDARVDIVPMPKGPDGAAAWDYRPTISVRTTNFPIEPLLINALPEQLSSDDEAGSDKGGFSIKSFLTQLHLDGPVDADIDVRPGVAVGDKPTVSAAVLFEGVTARPDHPAAEAGGDTAARLVMENLIGAIRVSDKGLSIDSLEGRLTPASVEATEQGPALPAHFRVDGEWSFVKGGPDTRQAATGLTATVRDLDVALPLEDLLRPIVPAAADEIVPLRAQRAPAGRIDLAVNLKQHEAPSDAVSVAATVTQAKNLQLTVTGQRVEIVQESGSVGVQLELPPSSPSSDSALKASPPPRIVLDNLAAHLLIDGEGIGFLSANGVVSMPAEATADAPATPLLVFEPLAVNLRGVRLESPVTRQLAERYGGAAVGEQIKSLKPEGLVDGELRLALPPGETDPAEWTPWVAIRPRWLAVTRGEGTDAQRMLFPLISGQVTLDGALEGGGGNGGGGRFEELTIVDEGWFANFNGTWQRTAAAPDPAAAAPSGGWSIDGTLDFESSGLPHSLLALLPPSVGAAVEGAKLQVLGDIEAPGTAVRLWSTGSAEGVEAPLRFSLSGEATFAGLFADPGITIDDANGSFAVVTARDGHGPARTHVRLKETAMRIAGLKVTGAEGELELKGEGTVNVPTLTGDAYGGRLLMTANAAQEPQAADVVPPALPAPDAPAAPSTPMRYTGSLELAGLRFADLLRDLQRTRPTVEGPLPPDTLVIADDDLPPDGSRGLVEAQLSVEGTTGDPASRTGRGEIRIAGGTAVLDLPGLTTLLSLASLQLPVSSPFDFAHADVHLVGDTLTFDRAAILSDSLALLGTGTMSIDTRALDMRMAGRGRARIPLLTDLLDGFRDELITARIRGTPDKPELTFENFSAVRAAFQGTTNPLSEALKTDLDRLERDRQRTLGVVVEAGRSN